MDEVEISIVIRDVFNERGIEIIRNPKVFCSIIDDLAYTCQKERKVLRRILMIDPKICELLYSVIISNENDFDTRLNKLNYELNEVYGVSDTWIELLFKMLFQCKK